MGRLIDIDSLRGCAIIRPTSAEEIKHIEACKGCINHKDIPTAYDPDKVVAELEEWSFKTEIVIPGSDGYDDTANREIVCTKNAIDIVKRGGIDES